MEEKGEKLSVNAEIYQEIKRQIITLQLLPGQLLMVQQLAKDLGVSRTPVREALVSLKNEGLVMEADGRKFSVTEITWKSMSNIYQARCIIECFAIHLAAEKAATDPSVLHLVRKSMEDMENCYKHKNYTGYFVADSDFHDAIISIVGNHILENWMTNIKDQQLRIRYLTTGISSRLEVSLSEHRNIMATLESGNIIEAEKAMEAHLDRSLTEIMKLRTQMQMPLSQSLIR